MAAQKLIIAGGGLAGCLTALAIRRARPELELLLVEEQPRFGGEHIWSFFDSDVAAADRAELEPLHLGRWPAHDIRFPRLQRRIANGYTSIASDRLDQLIRETLPPSSWRVAAPIARLEAGGVILANGETIAASGVIDARGVASAAGLDLAWQKFLGRVYRFTQPHGVELPLIMDATVDQAEGYHFVYCLPLSADELLIEDTYYSLSPTLDLSQLGKRLEGYAAKHGWTAGRVLREEQGVLPIVLAGGVECLWRDDAGTARIGTRGGFFHPTTGYSLPDAIRTASLIARQPTLDSASLHRLLYAEAKRLWRERRFYRTLNRMLFLAAEPHERYRVLEHFYRLDPSVVARFYAGQTTMADKLRILSGRPPVRLGRALAAISGKGAVRRQ